MALHNRSNSFPCKSHPTFEDLENNLSRLRSREPKSSSASSICTSLANLVSLYESIDSLIQLPSSQQALLSHEQGENLSLELLDGSLRLIDSCEISRNIVTLVRESVQQLESSIRRSKGDVDVHCFIASRKNIDQMIKKCIKNMNGFKEFSQSDNMGQDVKTIANMLKEVETIGFTILKTLLMSMSRKSSSLKPKRLSILSKFTKSRNDDLEMDQNFEVLAFHRSVKDTDAVELLMKLKATEDIIKEMEEGLERLFRNLVKHRVSLLNVLNR